MAPPRPPAGDKPAPKKSNPAAQTDPGTTDRDRSATQPTESALEPVRSSETVVGGLAPVADSEPGSGESRTGELEALPPMPPAPRRTGELRLSKTVEEPQRRKPTTELKASKETMVASPRAMSGGVVPKPDDTAEQITDRRPALKVEPPGRTRTASEVKPADAGAMGTVADLARPSGLLDEGAEGAATGEAEVLESRTALKLAPLPGGTNPSLRVKNARLDRMVIGIVAGALVVVLTAVVLAFGGGGKKAPQRHRAAQLDEPFDSQESGDDDKPVLHATAVPVTPEPARAPAVTPQVALDAGLASGLVRFEADPPSDVFIGGENKGTTPFFLALPVGHTKAVFTCTRLGLKRTVEFDVVAGKETTASTAFATGWVELHANAGAIITVDGKPVANKLLALLTGTHHVEAKFPSGAVASETVEVVQGMTITVYLEPDMRER